MKNKRTLTKTIGRFTGFKLIELSIFIVAVIIFHFIGNAFYKLVDLDVACSIKDIGSNVFCEDSRDVVMEYIGNTLMGLGITIISIFMTILIIALILWNWDMAKR